MKKALFLDRDGIINVDKSYVFKFSDIVWMDGIIELIKYANANDFLVIVLTNQSGIERGYYNDEDVIKLHQEMDNYLQSRNAIINDWFYCAHFDSEDRKPRPGMMLKAKLKYDIDLSQSFMIGDKESDILDLIGPEYLIVKGNYDLAKVENRAKLFNDLSQVLKYIESKI